MSNKVKITWNNQAGELDSVTVTDDGDEAITNALIGMIKGIPLSPGDSITVEEIG